MLAAIVGVLSVPIMILNFASGIVAGIWLAILGQWGLLGIGIVFLFTSHWLIGLLLLPMMPVDVLALRLAEKKNPLSYLFCYISHLYSNILIAITFLFAYLVCKSFYHGDTWIGYVPYVLWSWGSPLALGNTSLHGNLVMSIRHLPCFVRRPSIYSSWPAFLFTLPLLS